jgi:hypothetical protein
MADWYKGSHLPLCTLSPLNCDHISKTNVIPRAQLMCVQSLRWPPISFFPFHSPSRLQEWGRYLPRLRRLRHTTEAYCSLSIAGCQLNTLRSYFCYNYCWPVKVGQLRVSSWDHCTVNLGRVLRFVLLTAVTVNSPVFGHMTPCTPMKVEWRFGGTCCQQKQLSFCYFHAWFTLPPWTRRRYVPTKRRLTFNSSALRFLLHCCEM